MADYHNPYHPTSNSKMNLTRSQMQDNAKFIYDFMSSNYNWTLEAVCGLLANAESESTINPARPQINAVNKGWYPSGPFWPPDGAPNPTTTHYGFGLFQITPFAAGSQSNAYNPYTYGNWAAANGYTMDYSTGGTCGKMEPQLIWLMSGNPEKSFHNSANPKYDQVKWYQRGESPLSAPTPAIYGQLTGSPEDCAVTFYWNFERSQAGSVGDRPQKARAWYEYLQSYTPTPPTPPTPEPQESKFIPWYMGAIFFGGVRKK